MSDLLAGQLKAFSSDLAGRVVTADDADYDAVRAECVWNGDIDRRPWVIARATSAADVAAAVRFAEASRAGGLGPRRRPQLLRLVHRRRRRHDRPGAAVRGARSTRPARRAVCGGGTRWSQLDAATQEHGLAAPGGFISHTGVAGLTLGGGLGWLSRKAGLSCDNLLSVEIVTADGRIVRASADDNPDLFWAVRGGGGNFGVVTAFEFQLHEVGPMVQLGLSFWDLDHGPDAVPGRPGPWSTSLPDDIAVFLAALNAPPAPFVPEEYHGAPGYAVLLVGHGAADEHARSGRQPAGRPPRRCSRSTRRSPTPCCNRCSTRAHHGASGATRRRSTSTS